MLKKMLFVAALFGCLSLSALGVQAHAAPNADMSKADAGSVKKTVHVEMKGRIRFRADTLDIFLPDSRLVVNGTTYVVNLGMNRDLWHTVAALDGHTAVVTGTLDGDTVTATAIKGDSDFVHKTVKVEVKGRLIRNRPMRCRLTEFSAIGGGEYFGLDFATADLRELAAKLSGETVILSGTLEADTDRGNVLHVTELKAVVVPFVPEKVSVAVQGKLHYVIKHYHTGEVLFTCEKLPESLCRCWSIWYGVTIDGNLYQLDVGGNASLHDQAEKSIGLPVLAEGTLKKDVVKVTSLKSLS